MCCTVILSTVLSVRVQILRIIRHGLNEGNLRVLSTAFAAEIDSAMSDAAARSFLQQDPDPALHQPMLL